MQPVARCTAPSTHTTTRNTCCHNPAYLQWRIFTDYFWKSVNL